MFTQRSTADKIGMKDECFTLRLKIFLTLYTNYLSRCQENQCPFFIIIIITAVTQVATSYLLKKNGVKAITLTSVAPWRGFRHINHVHQRVWRIVIIKLVVLPNGIKDGHIFHKSKLTTI